MQKLFGKVTETVGVVTNAVSTTVNNVVTSGAVSNTVTAVSNAVTNTIDKISGSKIVKRNKIVEFTIDAKYLTQEELSIISGLIMFADDETLEILYLFGGKFDPEISFENCELVGITNKRIFKYNHNINKSVKISDIVIITHKIKYPLLWNKIQFGLANGTKEQIGIYGTSAPTFFIWYLTQKLPTIQTETHEMNHDSHDTHDSHENDETISDNNKNDQNDKIDEEYDHTDDHNKEMIDMNNIKQTESETETKSESETEIQEIKPESDLKQDNKDAESDEFLIVNK